MLMRWGREMSDNKFDDLEFRQMSPSEFIGMTIEGAELVEDGDTVCTLLLFAVDSRSEERRVFQIFSGGPDGMHWLDANVATEDSV